MGDGVRQSTYEAPLPQGCVRRGGGRGFGWDPPSSYGPPMVPAEGGPNVFEA